MKQRIWYILKTYLLTVAIFAIAKVVFMLSYHHAHSFAFTDICQVIWHGLSLDLSTALYFLIVPWLLTVASLWLPIKAYIFKGYYILMALAFSLAFVADTSLYAFWGFCESHAGELNDDMATLKPETIRHHIMGHSKPFWIKER